MLLEQQAVGDAQATRLFRSWSAPADGVQPRLEANVGLPSLSGFVAELGATEWFATLHSGVGAGTVIASSPQSVFSSQTRGQVVALAGERLTTLGPDEGWLTCTLEETAWHMLRLSIPCAESRSVVVLSFLYPGAGLPNPGQVERALEGFRPLLVSYFQLWQQHQGLKAQSGGLRSALNDLEMGVVALDRAANIVFMNDAASAVVGDGKILRQLGDKLSAVDVTDGLALQVALAHAISANSVGEIPGQSRVAPTLSLGDSTLPIIASVVPADKQAIGAGEVAAVVYLVQPTSDAVEQVELVCRVYGMTAVETALARRLAGGASLREAAAAIRIKEQTARGHLKQIFLKTGTKRQGGLIHLLLGSLVRTRRGIGAVFLL